MHYLVLGTLKFLGMAVAYGVPAVIILHAITHLSGKKISL